MPKPCRLFSMPPALLFVVFAALTSACGEDVTVTVELRDGVVVEVCNGAECADAEPDAEPDDATQEPDDDICGLSSYEWCDGACVPVGECGTCDLFTHQWCNGECVPEGSCCDLNTHEWCGDECTPQGACDDGCNLLTHEWCEDECVPEGACPGGCNLLTHQWCNGDCIPEELPCN